ACQHKPSQAAFLELRHGRGQGADPDRDLTCHHGRDCRAGAGEGNVHDVETKRHAKLLESQMGLRPRAPRSVAVLSGVRSDEGVELRKGVGRHGREDYANDRRGNRKGYRSEVLDGIIWRFAEECGICYKGADIQQDGVAIWCRLRGLSGAYVAGSTDDVLDIELLAEFSRKFLSDEPGKHIGRSARREWNDQAHWSRWISLRPSKVRYSWERGSAHGQMQEVAAAKFHGVRSRNYHGVTCPKCWATLRPGRAVASDQHRPSGRIDQDKH